MKIMTGQMCAVKFRREEKKASKRWRSFETTVLRNLSQRVLTIFYPVVFPLQSDGGSLKKMRSASEKPFGYSV
jgi:hypothetical protein